MRKREIAGEGGKAVPEGKIEAVVQWLRTAEVCTSFWPAPTLAFYCAGIFGKPLNLR
jgi:hypothetical protein